MGGRRGPAARIPTWILNALALSALLALVYAQQPAPMPEPPGMPGPPSPTGLPGPPDRLPPPTEPPSMSTPVPAPGPGMGDPPQPYLRRWTVEFLEQYPQAGTVLAVFDLCGKPILFVAILLLVGGLLGGLASRLLPPPASAGAGSRVKPDPGAQQGQAALQFAAWVIALLLAGQSAGMDWLDVGLRAGTGIREALGGIVSALLGLLCAVVSWAVFLASVGLIAYAFAPHSRDLILSLLGAYVLRRHPNRPAPDQSFDLGGGQMGTVQSVDLLHTTFTLGDGATRTMPNAWLMRNHFHWGETPPKDQETTS